MIFWVALRKELMEQWRTFRVLVVAAVLLLFGGFIAPLSAKYMPQMIELLAPGGEDISQLIPEPTAAVAVGEYVESVSQFGVLIALLVTMGAVAREKDRGTAPLMLVKPLPRSVFLIAKFAALGVTFAIGILVAAVACYYYVMVLFEALDFTSWLGVNGLLLLFLLVFVALTKVGEYLPGRLVSWAGGLMNGGGDPIWSAVAGSVMLIIAALLAAWVIFERQEL
jgi:ABC-2 type transport system permease protein